MPVEPGRTRREHRAEETHGARGPNRRPPIHSRWATGFCWFGPHSPCVERSRIIACLLPSPCRARIWRRLHCDRPVGRHDRNGKQRPYHPDLGHCQRQGNIRGSPGARGNHHRTQFQRGWTLAVLRFVRPYNSSVALRRTGNRHPQPSRRLQSGKICAVEQ